MPAQATPAGLAFVSVAGGPPRGEASATIQTQPGQRCSIGYVTPAGTQSQAQGLEPRQAGPDGRITWRWLIGSNTRPGAGRVNVTCNGATISATITIG